MSTSVSGRRSPLAWFGDRSVRVKILSAVLLTAVVALVVGLMGLRSLGDSADKADHIYSENVLGVDAAGDMNVAIQAMRQHSRDVLIAPDQQAGREAVAKVDADLAAFEEAAKAYEVSGLDDERRGHLAELRESVEDYYALQQGTLIPLGLENEFNEWYQVNLEQGRALTDAMKEHLDGLTEAEAAAAERAVTEVQDSYAANRFTALLLLTVGIGLALLVGWSVARSISRNVGKVREVADALADGDLTRTAGLTSRDEIGVMAGSLDQATGKLRELMGTVLASSDSVAAAAEEMSAASAQVAAGAEETSVQAGVVSGAAEEVSRNVQTVAAGSEQMGASIREIAHSANEAARVASQAVSMVDST
ncbi:HAMP domain-containing methyl-accepting chemotaxis protein, partial [Nocardioides ferulae]|uniref:HAMP domain-containing methyl-accepting chemotaxis protein n=1 Tax=Nocardioides ferulae TaxID=2340821 RepID=UPI0013DE5B2F